MAASAEELADVRACDETSQPGCRAEEPP